MRHESHLSQGAAWLALRTFLRPHRTLHAQGLLVEPARLVADPMTRPTHWCHGVSVSGPVDPSGCCADQPPSAATLRAQIAAERDEQARRKLAELLGGEEG